MEGSPREGDIRVQIIICFFFLCVVGGGVFLSLYIFLPESESSSWYYIAGIILEGIPWTFWLLTYIYSCFRPRGGGNETLQKFGGSIPRTPSQATKTDVGQNARAEDRNGQSSPVSSSGGDDQKHVRFGGVVVMENDDNWGVASNEERGREDVSSRKNSNCDTGSSRSSLNDTAAGCLIGSRECEIPLTMGVSSRTR